MSDISFGWEAEASQPAEKPSISYTEPVKAGDAITFSSTEGATISYEYGYGDSADTPSYTFSGTGTSFTVPDEAAGKYLYVSAKAGGEGFTESEAATAIIQIADLDKALAPTITAPAELKAGQEFTFSTETAGAQIYYQVAREDAETASPNYDYGGTQNGSSYYIDYSDAGKWLYFRVWAGGTGFEDSEYTENHFEIAPNPAAEAPEIHEPAELKIGQSFTFTSTQEDVTISYKYAVSETEIVAPEEPAYGEAAEGTEFTIPAEANGKWLYISATANGEKYTESTAATWGKQIIKTAEPVSIGYDVFDSTTVTTQGQDVEITGSTTGLNYTGYFNNNIGDYYGVGAYDKQTALANTDSKDGLFVEYVEYSNALYQTFASNKANVYVANEPITLANYESVATFVKTLTANPTDLRADIEGNYSYVAIISGGTGFNPLAASYINIGWKQTPAESNVAATPEFKNDLPSPLRAGTTLELTSATEGAKISYKVVYTDTADEVVDFDAITATEAQTAPVSFTIPDDAAQKYMRLWAQATADGYEASEPFVNTAYVDFPTGVIGIEVDEAEAEYYTLQGVRVANPEKGIYVKVQNGKADKVVL